MSVKATVISEIRQIAADQRKSLPPLTDDLVLLDSGNFSDNPTEAGDLRTATLLQTMKKLGYRAVNVGERDLNFGYDDFVKRTEGLGLSFISTNIVKQGTKEPIFPPYTVVEVKGTSGKKVRIGVLGVDLTQSFGQLLSGTAADADNFRTLCYLGKPSVATPTFLQKVEVDQPAGSQAAWDYVLGSNVQGTTYFPDWPKLATWGDAYYLAIDLQDMNNGFREVGVLACALDRANMLTGGTPNVPICFRNPSTSLRR